MEVTNFYVPNFSMRFKMIDELERYQNSEVKNSDDEYKLQVEDVPIGIWNCSKSNNEYRQLTYNLGINEINNDQILNNLMEGQSDYQVLKSNKLEDEPEHKYSILFKEFQVFEMYILKEARGWSIKSIAAKYGIDGNTVLRWVREVRNKIKRKWERSKLLHITPRWKVTDDHIKEVSSFLKAKMGWRITVAKIQNHLIEKNNRACISSTTLRKILKKNLGRVFKKEDII